MMRWTSHFFVNVLPVFFILWLVATLACIHHLYRVRPLLALQAQSTMNGSTYEQGKVENTIVQILLVLWLITFYRASTTSPGTVPDIPEYRTVGQTETKSYEVKMSGARRHCKWCDRYKPDRCHHCRQCGSCVLRMDHHCPWIGNCVGFRNHKYFFLLVVYSTIALWVFTFTLMQSLTFVLNIGPIDAFPASSAANRFFLLFGVTISTLLGCILICFLGFHTRLMLTATSTIEHCEKNGRHDRGREVSYDLGYYENVKSVLGDQPLFWLLPICPPRGDGTHFRVANAESLEVDLKKPLASTPIVLKVNKDDAGLGSECPGQEDLKEKKGEEKIEEHRESQGFEKSEDWLTPREKIDKAVARTERSGTSSMSTEATRSS